MSDIYQAPESNLQREQPVSGDYGSIEKAIAGDYEFSIGSVISEAWNKTGGTKWAIHLAFFYYFMVMIVLMVLVGILAAALTLVSKNPDFHIFAQIILQLGINLVALPMMVGVVIMGIRRSVNAPVNAGTVFNYFSKIVPLFVTMLLVYLMIAIGLLLLVIPGIYLMVAYYMAMPLVVEKGLSPWEAMEVSRKAITHRWFSVAALLFVMVVIMFISAIPLGLGMIWTLPMMMIVYGILYRNMFGVEADTIA